MVDPEKMFLIQGNRFPQLNPFKSQGFPGSPNRFDSENRFDSKKCFVPQDPKTIFIPMPDNLVLIIVLVVSVGSPAAIGAAASSRASVIVLVLRSNSSDLVRDIGVVLVPSAKLSIDALAFVAVPESDSLVLDGPIPVGVAHGTLEVFWTGVVD